MPKIKVTQVQYTILIINYCFYFSESILKKYLQQLIPIF